VLEGAEINIAENALQTKYGLKRKGFLLMMRANDEAKRAYIEVTPS
jgi:hypothetical protein